ncbi:MAG: SDR family oxidoreductase [Salinibacterium sp.]|nr:SDR family oxidoreductase [Salinibacterium sp.]
MHLDLTGVPVIITGAASGIGRACAVAFVAEGAMVAAIDRDAAALAGLAAELPGLVAVPADVTDETAMAAAVAHAAGELGGLAVAIACAGTSGPFGTAVDEISLADWNRVLAVNVTGQFLLVKHALPYLRRSSAASIVLMGSDSGFVAAPGMLPYNASKGAVVQLTRALSVDLAADGIRVTCVCPSIVDTPMARADLGLDSFAGVGYPVQSAEDVARSVLFLASPATRTVNGTTLVSDFGYLARSSFPA